MRIASNDDIVGLVRAGVLRPVSHETTRINGEERVAVTFEVVGEPTGVAVRLPAHAALQHPIVQRARAFDVQMGEYIVRLPPGGGS